MSALGVIHVGIAEVEEPSEDAPPYPPCGTPGRLQA